MENEDLKVITYDGFECLFYKTEDGTMAVLFSGEGGRYFQRKLLSIGQLKEGVPLHFSYYDAEARMEKFVNKFPIVSIEKIEET